MFAQLEVLPCHSLLTAWMVVSEPHAASTCPRTPPVPSWLLLVFGVGTPLSGAKCSVNLYGHGGLSPTLMLVRTGEEELALYGQAAEEPITASVPGQSSRSASGR